MKVVSKVPYMQHGRIMTWPGLLNEPLKAGRTTHATHVSIDQKLWWPILARQKNQQLSFAFPVSRYWRDLK